MSDRAYLNFSNDGKRLYCYEPVPGYAHICTAKLVMDKETFIMCYNKWIKNEDGEENEILYTVLQ